MTRALVVAKWWTAGVTGHSNIGCTADGRHALVADEPASFADSVVRLLGDDDLVLESAMPRVEFVS